MDLVLVHRGVEVRVEHHRRHARGVLLVVVRRAVVEVVVVRGGGVPVVGVVGVVVGVAGVRVHHGVQVRLRGVVEHGAGRRQGGADVLLLGFR